MNNSFQFNLRIFSIQLLQFQFCLLIIRFKVRYRFFSNLTYIVKYFFAFYIATEIAEVIDSA